MSYLIVGRALRLHDCRMTEIVYAIGAIQM
jgi:hypothetical protein